MKKIRDIIELQTNSKTESLCFATRYIVQCSFTFDLTITSGKFSGSSHFCVRREEIEKFCIDLTKMHLSLSGSSALYDNDSDGFVNFTINEYGHLIVNGQIGGSDEKHFVNFQFQTDQTCIPKLTDDFEILIKK